jgi:hypothetical protein
MNIIKSDTIAFCYTLKLNRLGATAADYDTFFDKCLKFNIKVEYKITELDSSGRLHYHGILYLKKGFFRKRICVPGMHIKLVECNNKEAWMNYIHKDVYWKYLEDEQDKIENPLPTKKLF